MHYLLCKRGHPEKMCALWERRRTKEGFLAVSSHPFQCGLCKREEVIQWSLYHHIPVLKVEKRRGKEEISIVHMFLKELLLFHSFCSALFVFQLSVRTDRGRGVVKQNSDRCGQGEGLETGKKLCGHPLWMTCNKNSGNDKWSQINYRSGQAIIETLL